MGDEYKDFFLRLEDRTYRSLQQMAKSLGLPSNYKKAYLIELIYAKKFRSEEIVKSIIQKVKIERLLSAKNQKDRCKNKKKISKTSKARSPSITTTPKCKKVYLPFSPEIQKAIMKHNSRRSLLKDIEQHDQSQKSNSRSDRILRSFNLRHFRTPTYKIVNNMTKIQNTNSKAVVKINTQMSNLHKFYVTAECVVKKHRPAILNTNCSMETKKPIILRHKEIIQNDYVAAKRRQTVSGIYPLILYKNFPQNCQISEVGMMRKNNGSITKINAIVQKINTNYKPRVTYCDTEINIQDIVESIEETESSNDLQIHPAIKSYETMSSQSVITPEMENNYDYQENTYSSYHRNEMREQLRYHSVREYENQQQRLPKINDVFSKFNNLKDVAQPLYVQVSAESELCQDYPFYADSNNCNTVLLESLYNFKSNMLTNAPLLQIATTANTKCIFSTATVTTARANQSALLGADAYNYSLLEPDNRYVKDRDPRLYDFFKCSQQQQMPQTEYNRWSRSTETLGCSTPATIPEMLEDAVELISQDGDYMEQIGMDVRVSCALCPWAGPNILLENHMQKEHSEQIVEARGGEWRVSWSLGALAGGSRVRTLRHCAALYVLRASYTDPECLTATIESISAEPALQVGAITVYNKRSGEPYTWTGYIQPLTNKDALGLRVDISQLDLLPNSANLKLLNRELVSDSLNKVIVGPPALNDINIVMFIKIF